MPEENTGQNGSHENSKYAIRDSSGADSDYGFHANSEQGSIPKKRVAVTHFIAALDYNADFHFNRGDMPPPVVPEATYRKAVRQRASAKIWGTVLLLIVGVLFLRTAIYGYIDIRDYTAGQPQHIQTSQESVNAPTVIIQRIVPSMHPLPENWERATFLKYTYLLLVMGVCGYLGLTALHRAHTIETGVPDTEQQPVVEVVAYLPSDLADANSSVPPRPTVNRQENQPPRPPRPPGEQR